MANYTNRKEYIDKLLSYKDKDLIKVVSGLRRSGKSTLLEVYREQLLKQGISKRQMQFFNFELPENYLNKTWSDIYFEIKGKFQTEKTNYIWQITSESTVEREFGTLEKINDNYPKFLLTTDSFTQSRSGIKHLNVFNWLLETSDKQK